MKFLERLKQAVPNKREAIVLSASAIPGETLVRVGRTVFNTAGTIILVDKMREDPSLVAPAFLTYALIAGGAAVLDYCVLVQHRASANLKTNLFYRLATALRPEGHTSNALAAETTAFVFSFLGLSTDVSAPISTYLALINGNPAIVAAQRISDLPWIIGGQVVPNILVSRLKR